ncbi:hypothetical protein EDB89DRAFT_1907924 [Lactarius sanguifluus]|nr:hypothetical protein EDB89DRAFT_1907924 [Lactarius sanguifluus]
MPAAPQPLPFPSAQPSLPVSARPCTKRECMRARRPGPSPFSRGAQYAERGHATPGPPPSSFSRGALYVQKGRMQDATRSLSLPHSRRREVHEGMPPPFAPSPSPSSTAVPSWMCGKGHTWARHPRPFPSPFVRKGGARGHAARQSPLAISRGRRKAQVLFKCQVCFKVESASSLSKHRLRPARVTSPLGPVDYAPTGNNPGDRNTCTRLREWGGPRANPLLAACPCFRAKGAPVPLPPRCAGATREWMGGVHPFMPTLVQHGRPGQRTNQGAPRDLEVLHPAQVSVQGRE